MTLARRNILSALVLAIPAAIAVLLVALAAHDDQRSRWLSDPGITPTAVEELVRFARAGIADYKIPYGMHILRELPTLPSGN